MMHCWPDVCDKLLLCSDSNHRCEFMPEIHVKNYLSCSPAWTTLADRTWPLTTSLMKILPKVFHVLIICFPIYPSSYPVQMALTHTMVSSYLLNWTLIYWRKR